jgi:hypothetical protein
MALENSAESECVCCSTLDAVDNILSRTIQQKSMPEVPSASIALPRGKHLLTLLPCRVCRCSSRF